jgi:hypothetical protein
VSFNPICIDRSEVLNTHAAILLWLIEIGLMPAGSIEAKF